MTFEYGNFICNLQYSDNYVFGKIDAKIGCCNEILVNDNDDKG